MDNQPAPRANPSVLAAIGKFIAGGNRLTLQEQLAAIAMLAAESDAQKPMRLWEAHHRKFQYTPLTFEMAYEEKKRAGKKFDKGAVFLRQERIDTKRYTAEKIRAAELANGCGKRRPSLDSQPRTRMYLPWQAGQETAKQRIISYTIVKRPDNTVERFDDIRIFRGGNAGSKVRRDLRLERSLTEGQWITLVKDLTERVLS